MDASVRSARQLEDLAHVVQGSHRATFVVARCFDTHEADFQASVRGRKRCLQRGQVERAIRVGGGLVERPVMAAAPRLGGLDVGTAACDRITASLPEAQGVSSTPAPAIRPDRP